MESFRWLVEMQKKMVENECDEKGTKVDFWMVDKEIIEEEIITLWRMVWSYQFWLTCNVFILFEKGVLFFVCERIKKHVIGGFFALDSFNV
jgi:hypothetical protein